MACQLQDIAMSTTRLTHLTKQALENAVLCGALGLRLLSGQTHTATPLENRAASYETALSLYQKHQCSRAFGEFSRLAETGHQESARIALFMLQHGSQLYATA
jgi:hypothetical protein